MFIDIIFVVFGLVALYFGGEWFVEGAARIARSFGLSSMVIGLTVVAFGTSTPELLVSLSAALAGNSDIAIGNVIGSNIANIGLILGMTGLIFPISVHIDLLRREIPILLAATAGTALLVIDGEVSRLDGVLMLIGLVAFNVFMIYSARREREKRVFLDEDGEDAEDPPPVEPIGRSVVRGLVGLAVLLLGAQLTVQGAVDLARSVGVSELVIGVTLVAFGTSLPELTTSIVAAFKKESDIAIGNIVGSNIYNLLSILGLTAVLAPIDVDQRVITFDGVVMVGFTLLLLPLVWNRVIQRREGFLLLTLYFIFIFVTVFVQ